MFDLAFWAVIYVGVGILRNALASIRIEREQLLSTFSYEYRLIRLLVNSKVMGGLLFLLGFSGFLGLQMSLIGLSFKVTNVLVQPNKPKMSSVQTSNMMP